jgi:hypothetical protein
MREIYVFQVQHPPLKMTLTFQRERVGTLHHLRVNVPSSMNPRMDEGRSRIVTVTGSYIGCLLVR